MTDRQRVIAGVLAKEDVTTMNPNCLMSDGKYRAHVAAEIDKALRETDGEQIIGAVGDAIVAADEEFDTKMGFVYTAKAVNQIVANAKRASLSGVPEMPAAALPEREPTAEPITALCPFCSALAEIVHDRRAFQGELSSTEGWRVDCAGPKCHAMTCWWHTEGEAIEAWNRRASPLGAAAQEPHPDTKRIDWLEKHRRPTEGVDNGNDCFDTWREAIDAEGH